MRREPSRTSSSGKASSARRNWSCRIAFSVWSDLALRSTEQQADEQRRRAADALERAERVAAQLVALAHLGDQHPVLSLLREEADVEVRLAVDAEIGHLGELGVAEGGGVLRRDGHCHRNTFYDSLHNAPTD